MPSYSRKEQKYASYLMTAYRLNRKVDGNKVYNENAAVFGKLLTSGEKSLKKGKECFTSSHFITARARWD
jgi:hypothetical protein